MSESVQGPGLTEALAYLDTFQFHGFRLGLERMEAILEALDRPERAYPSIHVAGTNGKGSTCAVINSILSQAGYKTGFYSSPHLYRLNERFRIGNSEIDDSELADILTRIRKLIEAGFEMSYFEYTTAAAMLWFRERAVDIAIFETGLGGRLDATNVIEPEISVITNIALEHQAYLGNTIGEIAFEKAGIIKSGRPAVCAETGDEALSVIRERCRTLGAPLMLKDRDFSFETGENGMTWHGWDGSTIDGIHPSLAGSHQAGNAALAIAAVRMLPAENFTVSDRHIRDGCKHASWPGRGEILHVKGRKIILDGAHNINGMEALTELLESMGLSANVNQGQCLLYACSDEGGDKDFAGMLNLLFPYFSHVIITEPPGPRKPVSVAAWQQQLGDSSCCILEADWSRALARALEQCGKGGLICVAGSLYLVGSVRARLKSPFLPAGET